MRHARDVRWARDVAVPQILPAGRSGKIRRRVRPGHQGGEVDPRRSSAEEIVALDLLPDIARDHTRQALASSAKTTSTTRHPGSQLERHC